jgi:hypothetical protein
MRSRGVRHSKKGSDVKFVVAGLACCLLLGLIVFGLLFLTGQNPGPGADYCHPAYRGRWEGYNQYCGWKVRPL